MDFDRLPETTLALATELRELAVALEPELAELPLGTPVAKTVAGHRYWYLQSRGGGLDAQRFLGRETPEMLLRLREWRDRGARLSAEIDQLRRLNDMVAAGGVTRESAAATRVLELLAASGLFRRGGILIGTRAFAAYGLLLGFRAPAAARTQDLDVAVAREVAVALPRLDAEDLAARLAEVEPPFLPVPDLDPRRASTSFKLRGRELRVDFLTPRRRREDERPVPLPAYGVAAWPLDLLEVLLVDTIPAIVCGTRPVLVRVPDPARFALHKLWLTAQRSAVHAARAAKDLAQAGALLAVLLDERPSDLHRAALDFAAHPRALAVARRQSLQLKGRLGSEIHRILRRTGQKPASESSIGRTPWRSPARGKD